MEQRIATPSLSFSEAINKAASRSLEFKGRSRRSEFWWTMLIVYIISLLVPPIGFVLSLLTIPLAFRRLHDAGHSGWWWGCCAILESIITLYFIFDYIMIILNVEYYSVEIESTMLTFFLKFFILYGLVFIYKIVLIVLYCKDSEPYENKYGESPKYVVLDEQVSNTSDIK
jgi:uncharacterized membrane protein YhaH (DUF805 family)